jgi:hypothetical protein
MDLLQIGPRVTALPVIHGSADFAWEVRRLILQMQPDCLAVPLPPSFARPVMEAVLELPQPALVAQRVLNDGSDGFGDSEDEGKAEASYVPIDPCQPVIAALRVALEERIPFRFIDLETNRFRPLTRVLPDAYALKKASLEQFSAAVLPFLRRSSNRQWQRRVAEMAWQLRELSIDFKNIAFVTGLLEWPYVREAFLNQGLERPEPDRTAEPQPFAPEANSLYFLFGELPYVTALYERARAELEDDSALSIDSVKHVLIEARRRYMQEEGKRARKIPPKLLAQCLQYIRNLTLVERCFTPQLITIATAAKQMMGDSYAIQVLETAKDYGRLIVPCYPTARMGIDSIAAKELGLVKGVSRLPGPPLVWSNLELLPRPSRAQQADWQQRWNPNTHCSWPPEDETIENFRQAVFDRAKEVLGTDMIKTEKFTSSIKDGIDIRDTLRNWHTGELYVKVMPPNRGKLDCAVMLFDSPADPRDYPWRTTWFAEHPNESTLAFYATNFLDEPIGPGICMATYGGAMFIFPPISIPDIWTDRDLDFAETLEERLISAACIYSRCRHIALVSPGPPGIAWKRLAKHFGKTLVHLPLGRFSDSTVQQLRMVHVLNGKQVRSYAAHFIRK